MNVIVLGPQMSGKGTQAKKLVEKYHLNYIEMGNILRSIANSNNQHAEIVKKYQNEGQLVPDEYVRLIAWDHISKQDREKGFLFDGYPRSIDQYEHVKDMLRQFGKKLDAVFYINISEAEIVRRLSGRRVCTKCGAIYNLVTGPFPVDNKCTCGGEIEVRADDNEEATKNRLAYYKEKVLPLIEKVRSEGLLREINGEQSIEKIHSDIVAILEK